MSDYRESIQSHYDQQARATGLSSASTMPDEIVREKEIAAIQAVLDAITPASGEARILEIGCGNGFLLDVLRRRYPAARLHGLDYTEGMVALARSRELPGVEVAPGDITHMAFPADCFDVVISERVIINLLDRRDQHTAFGEIARVLRPGGHFICIEAFAAPLRRLNEARAELALAPIPMPAVNRWFEDEDFRAYLEGRFTIDERPGLPPSTFLSSHYFATRVLHDLVKPEGGKVRNTHFARFFAEALPIVGDYAPVKLALLRRV